MKKLFYGLLVAVIVFALYSYQKPILSTEEAVIKAYEHLSNQPPEMEIKPIQLRLEQVPAENIRSVLHPQEGLVNRLFNKQQWEVTIKYQDVVPTVVMDANTGEFKELYGPLN